MVFWNFCVLLLWMKVASAFEGLRLYSWDQRSKGSLTIIHLKNALELTTINIIHQKRVYLTNNWRGGIKPIRKNNFSVKYFFKYYFVIKMFVYMSDHVIVFRPFALDQWNKCSLMFYHMKLGHLILRANALNTLRICPSSLLEKIIRIHNTSKNTLWVNPSMHNPYAAGG